MFPATRVGSDYFADGSVRQIAPLSLALHLGARRLLVIAVGQFTGQRPPPARSTAPRYPSCCAGCRTRAVQHLSGQHGADLERMPQINQPRSPYRLPSA